MDEEDDYFRAEVVRQDHIPRRKPSRPWSVKELEKFLEDSTDDSKVLMSITKNDECLERLLKEEAARSRTKLIVKVLVKAVKKPKNSQHEGVLHVLRTFINSETFHNSIAWSLQSGQADEKYVLDILALIENSLESFLNIAAKALARLFLQLEDTIDALFKQNEGLTNYSKEVKKLLMKPQQQARLEEEEEHERQHFNQDIGADPNHFRELSIVPTAADFDPDQDIRVRHNKIRGAYNNVNDYLDIQFRLLRADLILPLRENILQFLDGHGKYKPQAIRIYHQVRIVRPVCHDKGLCFRLSFDVSKHKNVNWAVSQRLKYGSLLCLSDDNFLTYQYAVVEDRDPKDLSKGLVDVQFIFTAHGANLQLGRHEEFMNIINGARDKRFLMVESPSYFEAYKHVLIGLQHITENNFPFWRYIGECNKNINNPLYLANGENAVFDLRPLIDTSFIIKDRPVEAAAFSTDLDVAAAINVLDFRSWPTANSLNLDNSQFVALQSALTKEFSIIQGPPGTGKTHLGLLVLKALLHNKHAWTANGELSPILLVCYTNHALDQFLEGILEFFEGNLIRVGSRSKSEKLEEYNLRGMRNRARENRQVPLDIHLARHETRLEMKGLKAEIHIEAAKLEILEREIVKESFLKCVIHQRHFQFLTEKAGGESIITKWLGISVIAKGIEDKAKRQEERDFQTLNLGPVANNPLDQAEEIIDEELTDDEEDGTGLFEVIKTETHYLAEDSDEDDDAVDEEDDLFRELVADGTQDLLENIRNINRKLDDVDKQALKIQQENIAFNISEYGEQSEHSKQSKKERAIWKRLRSEQKQFRAQLLGYLQRVDKMTEDEVDQVHTIWKLKKIDRWRLYRYWVDLFCRQIRGEIRDKSHQYEMKSRRYQEILHQEDRAILEKATIIGMTTTGAARYQGILNDIGPKIVLIEEAAEVLEGHVITSLSDRCQHVIMIGDHKQLRPNPSVHKLKKKYDLDISLFERLIRNDFFFDKLMYQHRMRPEIAKLLHVSDLYPDLKDHDIVRQYPDVMRVKGNVCFIQHYESEEEEGDTKTFINKYEARFLIGLCEYLLQQGQFTAKQITILSPYAGQIHYIRSHLESLIRSQDISYKIKGLKISSVDNYQGEENDVILLSLVRSNVDNDIGFLKVNNRICVALSRAKIGLYVIGNFVGISKSSDLMHDIITEAGRLGYVNDHIALACVRHPLNEKNMIIKKPADFQKVPEGGCSQPCGMRLNCGHSCKRICHADDQEHTKNPCRDKCQHKCEKCGNHCTQEHRCGEHDVCWSLVEKCIPTCGHMQEVPCHMEPHRFECQKKCQTNLPCGHQCPGRCGTRHDHTEIICNTIVKVTPLNCDHGDFETECGLNKNDTSNCPESCGTILECEHRCTGTCGQCYGGRLHVDCKQKCQKILICGHPCRDTCNNCPPCTRQCETECCHSKCPKKCGEECSSCVELCSWICEHERCSDLCCQPCQRSPCNLQCPERLLCGHICSGLCGEKCPRLCSVCDREELINASLYGYDGDPTTQFVELDCHHVVEVDFMDQWMATSTATEEDSGQQIIGLKPCPVCKSPVRKCSRYNKQIKEMLLKIESVKRKCRGERLSVFRQRRDQILTEVTGQDRITIDSFLERGNQVLSETILKSQIIQINLFRQISALRHATFECQKRWEHRVSALKEIVVDLDHFSEWVLRLRTTFSEQNILDAKAERDRLALLIDLHKFEMNISTRGLRNILPQRHLILLGQSIQALTTSKKADKKVIHESKVLCEELAKLVPDCHIALTYEEKMEIVKAVNVSQGAWYSCPNGHIYAIGECGQAMEEGTCPECKAAIGGTNHALRADNAPALDMDGSAEPIWNNIDADREMAERLQRELNEEAFLL